MRGRTERKMRQTASQTASRKANAVVAAMNAEPCRVGAQRVGCVELLALRSRIELQAIVDAGGVTAVVAALRQHTADSDTRRYGCIVLGRLVRGDAALKQAVVDAGGVAALVEWEKMNNKRTTVE